MKNEFNELDDIIKSKILTEDGEYKCSECNYTSRNHRNVCNHIESKHLTTGGAQCQVCHKVCPTREALRKHFTRTHKL